MRRFVLTSAALLMIAGTASAADICKAYPQAEWMPKETLSEQLKAKGYEIASIKEEDGCWEVKGKKDGKRVEDYFDPKTGELVESK